LRGIRLRGLGIVLAIAGESRRRTSRRQGQQGCNGEVLPPAYRARAGKGYMSCDVSSHPSEPRPNGRSARSLASQYRQAGRAAKADRTATSIRLSSRSKIFPAKFVSRHGLIRAASGRAVTGHWKSVSFVPVPMARGLLRIIEIQICP
jgi:hypothetical protein